MQTLWNRLSDRQKQNITTIAVIALLVALTTADSWFNF